MGAALADFQAGMERAFGGVPALARLLMQVLAMLRVALARFADQGLAHVEMLPTEKVLVPGVATPVQAVIGFTRTRTRRVVRAPCVAVTDVEAAGFAPLAMMPGRLSARGQDVVVGLGGGSAKIIFSKDCFTASPICVRFVTLSK